MTNVCVTGSAYPNLMRQAWGSFNRLVEDPGLGGGSGIVCDCHGHTVLALLRIMFVVLILLRK